jgi:hypothetical protein
LTEGTTAVRIPAALAALGPGPAWVFPVVHWHSLGQALDQAALCFRSGADGVFLIDMAVTSPDSVNEAAPELRRLHPRKLVGANYLAYMESPERAVRAAAQAGFGATWLDWAGVDSRGPGKAAEEAAALARKVGDSHAVFAACAFKGQAPEPDPGAAAREIRALGWIPTTSGPGTGRAADPAKVRAIADAVGDWPVALASGVTPGNVGEYLAAGATCILAATGIERRSGEFDEGRLADLVGKVRAFNEGGGRP